MSHVPYSSVVGSIMYAMVGTRFDVSQAVSVVSRYMKCPGKTHWEAVKWILRYLKGTIDMGIVHWRDNNGSETTGFVDSDHAGGLDDRRYLVGYMFTLAGGAIS